jgi:hypothetical protein
MKETFTYNILYGFMILGFANSLFVLSALQNPDTSDDKLTGPNMFTAFVVTMKGEIFKADKFKKMNYPYLFGSL